MMTTNLIKAFATLTIIAFIDASAQTNTGLAFCLLPAETGMCRAYIPRYFYDANQRKCIDFIFGGCGGNENNFESLENCTKVCGSTRIMPSATPANLPARCYLEADRGNCGIGENNNMIIRFFYNPQNETCEVFTWSGCRGNENRFDDARSCQETCYAKDQRITATGIRVLGGGDLTSGKVKTTTPASSGTAAEDAKNDCNVIISSAILLAIALFA